MKPAPFEYYAPTTIDDAVRTLGELGDDAKVLAGGQSLIPMLNLRLTRFAALVDIGRVRDLRSISRENGTLTVGATVAQFEIEHDGAVATSVPLLSKATPFIGHFQIRSRGTIGGSIAHADPAAEYPVVALTLDAELEATGPNGRRLIPANEFFIGMWMTALESEEILTAVRFPVWEGTSGFAVEEVARRHGDFALAGAVAGVTVTDGQVSRAAVGLLSMGSTPLRASAVESALLGTSAEKADLTELGQVAVEGLEPPDDLHASSALRRRIGAATVTRALQRAIEEAGRA